MQPAADAERASEMLGVPPERWLRTCISLGYPADAHAVRVSRQAGTAGVPLGRKPMAEFVSWERFGQRQP